MLPNSNHVEFGIKLIGTPNILVTTFLMPSKYAG